jgi:mRNA-degrading endonuclease RelE of RelBE toxin-antitoxin system
MRYAIRVTDDAKEQIARLTARQRTTLLDAIERQLRHEPLKPTRNRKPMDPDRRSLVASWELRVGALRVYYAVEAESSTVVIVAVGLKLRERVVIGGTAFQL